MARNTKPARRRRSRRRRKAGSSRVGSSNPRTRIPSAGLKKLSVMRNFSLYPKQWKQIDSTSWLDKMIRYGSIAMKVFTTLILSEDGVGATWQITGVVETILLGPEDLVWSSPLREDGLIGAFPVPGVGLSAILAPTVDYQQGKFDRLVIKLTAGSELAKRAGRVSMAITPLTLEAAVAVEEKKIKTPSFDQLVLMPGAVTAPLGPTLTLVYVPKAGEFGSSYSTLGQPDMPNKDKPDTITGGLNVLALHVGYQDFAASTADPSVLYAPEEALFNVDVSGAVSLKQWGTTWIRGRPMFSDSTKVGCCIGNMFTDIPAQFFEPRKSGLFLPWEKMNSHLRRIVSLQSSSPHPLSILLPEDTCDEEEDSSFEFLLASSLKIVSPSP